jgi:hypothetical protein
MQSMTVATNGNVYQFDADTDRRLAIFIGYSTLIRPLFLH